jgi:hypothetical protein
VLGGIEGGLFARHGVNLHLPTRAAWTCGGTGR